VNAVRDYNAGVDFRVDAITLDLDDTLWPVGPKRAHRPPGWGGGGGVGGAPKNNPAL
jgi:hypothetical protein